MTNFFRCFFFGTLLVPGLLRGVVLVDAGDSLRSSVETPELLDLPGYGAAGVVAIAEGNAHYKGTGVLVAQDWVLTAAHNWDTAAVTGLSFSWNGRTVPAQPGAWYQHSGWLSNPGVGTNQGWDLALFRLSEPLTGASPASIYGGSVSPGMQITFLGAGLKGIAGSTQSNTAGTLFAGTNTIDRVLLMDGSDGAGGLLAFDFDDGSAFRNSLSLGVIPDTYGDFTAPGEAVVVIGTGSDAQRTYLEAASIAGDSGGPAFVDFGNGPELVGIVSWGVNPTDSMNPYGSGLGDVTYLTDLTWQNEWILSMIPESSRAPEIIAAGILCCVILRRRSAVSLPVISAKEGG
jgi:hypothetical protein